MIKQTGEMSLTEANEMNVPVNISIEEPEEPSTTYTLSACNYMPRKSFIAQSQYVYISNSKEELIGLVEKYIVPLYRTALRTLERTGELYYWEEKP